LNTICPPVGGLPLDRVFQKVFTSTMSPKTVQTSEKSSTKILKISQIKTQNLVSEPVVNKEEKGIFSIFKSFLAVGGDFV